MSYLAKAAVWAEDCPQCKKPNYFDEYSEEDTEALQCWACQHQWLLEMCDEWTTLEEARIEKGRKKI